MQSGNRNGRRRSLIDTDVQWHASRCTHNSARSHLMIIMAAVVMVGRLMLVAVSWLGTEHVAEAVDGRLATVYGQKAILVRWQCRWCIRLQSITIHY